MLAEKYSYKSPWEQQREEALREQWEHIQERKRQKELARQQSNLMLRKYISVTLMVIMGSYAAIVFRSEAFASVGRDLVVMKQQEKALRAKNEELKIEVEELKGPNRIIRLAEQKLGMHVSRENIYMQGL